MEDTQIQTIELLEEQNELLIEANTILYQSLESQNEVLAHMYATQLFTIGVTATVLVLLLLYKFFKLFY